jgi:hypothetical protein
MSKKSTSELLKLAGDNQMERFKGRHCVDSSKRNYNRIDVNCIMCGRKMTTTKEENPPYYCYRCDDEAEGVFGLG